LGSGLGGVLARRKLSGSTTLPIAIIGFVESLQMVFTNSIMTTHVNRIAYRPLMSPMAIGRYKSANVTI
jgi:hypothetical protein